MALQLPWDAFGVTFPEAYARVEDCRVRSGGDVLATIIVYTDNSARHAVGNTIAHFMIDKAGDNIHTQAYAAAKLLPEFAGAVDV